MSLDALIQSQIERTGPLNLAEYMSLCLYHPEFGYYRQQNAIGRAGDFITAPEISQMFGELIGLSLAQAWLDQGSPSEFILCELGPGRGQLMADILRASKGIAGFHSAMRLYLIESSATHQAAQSDLLSQYDPIWLDDMAKLPEGPLFLVANEFFDCLPIRQFIANDGAWVERMIGWGDGLQFVQGQTPLSKTLPPPRDDQTWLELRPSANAIAEDIAKRIAAFGGAGLIIDYGDWGSTANTFQAIQAHQKTDPLCALGQSDLTAHVDFHALANAMTGVAHSQLTPQGVFLERLGITQRAQGLANRLDGDALTQHIAAHRRLTHPDEMGMLFKCLGLWHPDANPIAGLSE